MGTISSPLSRCLAWLDQTPLSVCADDLLTRFRGDGYAESTICRYVRAIAHFGEWLDSQGLEVADYSTPRVTQFVEQHLSACRCRIRIDRDRKTVGAALRRLGEVLHATGHGAGAEAEAPPWPAPVQQAVELYDQYLYHTRGAAAATRTSCRRYVGYFLVWRYGDGPIVPEALGARDLHDFLLQRAPSCKPGTLGVIATALRSYLRYLVVRGHDVGALIGAIPSVAQWRQARLPQHLTDEQEERLLKTVDRRTATGQRDYAVLLLMCKMGLRASDVAALTLDAIDWHTGTVALYIPKGRKRHLLPLPEEVLGGLVVYLRRGRPASRDRHVFLRHRAPYGTAVSCALIRGVVRRAYARAGFPAAWTGTHRLRHTAAVHMLQQRATLKQIADVLGHRSMDTTAVYAKVDLATLRKVALPWPRRMP